MIFPRSKTKISHPQPDTNQLNNNKLLQVKQQPRVEVNKMSSNRNVSFCIDRGGTFTDVYAEWPTGNKVLKLLSEDPSNYADAPTEGIRRVLEEVTGARYPRGTPIDTSKILSIRMGTTVATNALLERKGERFALLTTSGFRDLLYIGNQSRPNIFDLQVKTYDLLYEEVLEINERVVLPASRSASGREPRGVSDPPPLNPTNQTAVGITGEKIEIRKPLDTTEVKKGLESLKEKGITSIAVVLMHSAVYPDHELAIGKIAQELGFKQISLSHQVMPMVKIVPRGFTTCADAYLTPHVVRYLDTFVNGFDSNLRTDVQLSFMQSDGGLTPIDRFTGHRAILSGPAGGVVGYAMTSRAVDWGADYSGEEDTPVIGFDMGGTSTDVSRYSDGRYEHVHESTTAGITIQAPQLNIVTVAAGGGSRLFFQAGLFVVGPESAGANPGPVCYRKGGYLAVTDANVVLGRVVPELFPNIFGPGEDQPLDVEASRKAFQELNANINEMAVQESDRKTAEEVAFGFLKVANEAMCRPIRELTQMKGFDITTHVLACFGGAGGQHACAIARNLGISRVFVHRFSGILSAYGMGLASLVEDVQEPSAQVYDPNSNSDSSVQIQNVFERLSQEATEKLVVQGIPKESVVVERFLNMRYQGTDCALMIPAASETDWNFHETFASQYKREFGFIIPDRSLLIDDIRVRVLGKSSIGLKHESENWSKRNGSRTTQAAPPPNTTRKLYCEKGWVDAPLYETQVLCEMCKASNIDQVSLNGPALIVDATSTIVLEPGCVAFVEQSGDVKIVVDSHESQGHQVTTALDPIQLSIFSHRFMGIAEQMGRTLQRTSVSVNIKERLDFSCALFGPTGGLIANAPHIPVHLGAMQEAVKCQMNHWAGNLQEGDVLMSNHPQLAGGSHLPDITVMTPVFHNNEIVFWVASRGHHADIGGIAPGSMPPMSKYLSEEGAAVVAFKLVEAGVFQEAKVSKLLTTPPDDSPQNSGTRNLEDNLSDLKAQVAANNKGIQLVNELISQYTLQVVHAYMNHIIENAEISVRSMLKQFANRIMKESSDLSNNVDVKHENGIPIVTVRAKDFMDDGSPICLAVTINSETGNAKFDFAGTGHEVFGNINAPPAVTYSAVIYCLRSMVGLDIPLNQGCLQPVTFSIPSGSLLDPSPESAVVGGNVLTSQRVVDVVLQAFQACAASQGCMNNLTFGDNTFGYYETIAGGAGAGPGWDGRSGIHTHMTNTRITDPETLERRYPVVLREFSIRSQSGGAGKFRGGDGINRELEFLRPVTLSILSERRAFQPYGMKGGCEGERGYNYVFQALPGSSDTYRTKNIGGRNTCNLAAGDRIRIATPGAGGYGTPE